MLYQVLKVYVRLAMPLFHHSIKVDKIAMLKSKGPLLIASNHPNSFLDAIIFDIIFDIPVTSLARGDAFKSNRIFRILRALKMLPVYRIREGAKNLNGNYETFDACIKVFKQEEGVLIFSEGLCVNEWHLRPLKKGTARLAFKAWSEGVPLKVLPAGINYSSFKKYGKKIHIHFGEMLKAEAFAGAVTDGERNTLFNKALQERLQPLTYEIKKNDAAELKKRFGSASLLTKILLAPFALLGAVLHAPLYLPVRIAAKAFNKGIVHFDSLTLGFLLFSYPLYLLIAVLVLSICIPLEVALSALIILPLTAFCYVRYEIRKG